MIKCLVEGWIGQGRRLLQSRGRLQQTRVLVVVVDHVWIRLRRNTLGNLTQHLRREGNGGGKGKVGVPSAESGNFATFGDRVCCVTLPALELALSVHYIQKVQTCFALFQHVPLSWC